MKPELHLEKYAAYLFDLDGTLVDSMQIHHAAWIETLQEFDCHISLQTLQQYAGVPNLKTVEIFNQLFGWKLSGEKVTALKEQKFLEKVHLVKPIDDVLAIAQHYRNRKPMAIVTGSARPVVSKILSSLSLETLFPLVVCAEDTILHKPNPEPFLLAAQLLKIPPEECLVFEDGEPGIRAAQAGKMTVLKVEHGIITPIL